MSGFEWRGGHDFAHLAEALGLPTSQLMSAAPASLVMFTPEDGTQDEHEIHMAAIAPHPATKILTVMHTWRVTTIGKFKAELQEVLEQLDKDGDDA